jgi:O-antigen/teichoic acid export membrane protein
MDVEESTHQRETGVIASVRSRATATGELLLGKEHSSTIRQRLLAGVAGLLSLRVAFGAISFAVGVLLARLLGTRDLGAYTYALAWVTLANAPAIVGLDQLLVREIPKYRLSNSWSLLRGMIRASNWIALTASAGLIFIAVSISWLLRGHAAPGVVPTLWVSLVLIPLIALTRLRMSALQGLHRVVVGSVPERLVLPGLTLLFLLAVELTHYRLTAPVAMGINVFANVVAFSLGAWTLYRNYPAEAAQVQPEYQIAAWIRAGVPLFLLNSVGVVFSQSDILILGMFRGPAIVGQYGVADRTAELLSVVLYAQSAAFASTASSLTAEKQFETLQRLATRLARLTLLSTIPAAIVFLGFGDWFLSFFYGPNFVAARIPLVFLSLGQIAHVAGGLNGLLLVMMGETEEAVKVVGISAAVNVGLSFVLASRWGMNGAGCANMISLVVWNVLATVALERKTGIHTTVFGKRGRRPWAAEPPGQSGAAS